MEFVIASLKVVLVQNFTLRSAKPCNNTKNVAEQASSTSIFLTRSAPRLLIKKESLLAVNT